MVTRTPTTSDIAYGPMPYHRFDYYKNPVDVMVGGVRANPVKLYHHGGGQITGGHQVARTSAYGELFYLIHWLTGAQAGTNPAPYFDLISYSSAQQNHFDFLNAGFSHYPRSRQVFFPDSIHDRQWAIATIKRMLPDLGCDPTKVIDWGSSAGAWEGGLAHMKPVLRGYGERTVWAEGSMRSGAYDSSVAGMVYEQGQIDCRNIAGTDYLRFDHCSGWVGTRYDNASEWNAVPAEVKKAMSLKAYFEDGEIDSYPGFYVLYPSGGSHTKPLSNPHDSIQHTELVAAMQAAGLTEGTGPGTYGQKLYTPGDLENTNWPGDPSGAVLAKYQDVAAWMLAQITAAAAA